MKYKTNICFSNKMRKQINHKKIIEFYQANKKGAELKALELKAYTY